jgi:hypothetical protein
MKVKLEKNPENLELLAKVGSRNKATSQAAQEILAALVGNIVEQVLQQAATSELIYSTYEYDFDTVPSIPLDLFEDNDENYIRVWSQSIAGGLPTNVIHGTDEYRFQTYRLDSAVSFLKRYAKDGRLNVVAKAIERMAQEILVDMEDNAWAPILAALAESETPDGLNHLISATTAGRFQLHDLNKLFTKISRIHTSWTGGTPASLKGKKGLTDLLISPEVLEDIRAFAYQPMNTIAVPDTAESTVLGLPDQVRAQYFSQGGVPSIYGVKLHVLNELGVNKSYNSVFDTYYTPAGSQPTFNGASQEVIIGVDLSQDAFIRAVASEPTGDYDVASPSEYGTVITLPDDQFYARQEQVGLYTRLEEGRVVLDNKALVGVIR